MLSNLIIIGERINSSRETVADAVRDRNAVAIQQEALSQIEAGADYVDVNAGTFVEDEPGYLSWLVRVVQEVTDIPLCLDSSNPEAMEAALKQHRGKALVNSITAEARRYDLVLPLVKKHRCGVVALCIDDNGIPATAPQRVAIARHLVESLIGEGVPPGDIFIDPVAQPLSVDSTSGIKALEAIGEIAGSCPGSHVVLGLSNISFGLPSRRLLNRVFLLLALSRGLDTAILDPCDRQLVADVIAASSLLGRDDFCMDFLNAYRLGKTRPQTSLSHNVILKESFG